MPHQYLELCLILSLIQDTRGREERVLADTTLPLHLFLCENGDLKEDSPKETRLGREAMPDVSNYGGHCECSYSLLLHHS